MLRFGFCVAAASGLLAGCIVEEGEDRDTEAILDAGASDADASVLDATRMGVDAAGESAGGQVDASIMMATRAVRMRMSTHRSR
jgi:hypothetical protein